MRPEEQEQWLSVRDLGIVLKELLVHLGMGKVKEEENGVKYIPSTFREQLCRRI